MRRAFAWGLLASAAGFGCGGKVDPEVAVCLEAMRADQPFALDESGPGTQIHAELAFARSRFWAVWSAARDGAFVTRAASYACDGTPETPAFDLSPVSAGDHLDPTLVADGDGVSVAWQSNDSSLASNLDIWLAQLDPAGEIGVPPFAYEGRRLGQPVTGNAWMPALAGSSAGPVLVGAWGHPAAPAFQAFAQRFTEGLFAEDEAIDLELSPARTQVFPDVSVDAAGAVWAVWDDSAEDQRVRLAAWGEGPPVVSTPSAGVGGQSPMIASGGAGTFVVWRAEGGVVLTTAEGLAIAELGSGTVAAPTVAVGEAVVAVAWLENLGGLNNALHLAFLNPTGALISESALVPERVPPYPARLRPVVGDTFSLAWQQGQSPDFEAFGVIVGP